MKTQRRHYPKDGTRPRGGVGGQAGFTQPSERGVVSSLFLFILAGVGFAAPGCGFWEEVTSREFTFKGMFTKPDPIVVLRDDKDGDHRQKALRQLKEPKQNGGTDKEQDMYVAILVNAAVSEPQGLVALAAIQTMAAYKDPRVVEGLKKAYYRATRFNAETTTILKCAALAALGETGHPAAVELLVTALKEPPVSKESVEGDRQHKMDERLAAARALGHFKQYQAADALVAVLRKEKDVALCDCVHKSLVEATGKELPPDPKLWDEFLVQQHNGPPQQEGPIQKLWDSITQTSHK